MAELYRRKSQLFKCNYISSRSKLIQPTQEHCCVIKAASLNNFTSTCSKTNTMSFISNEIDLDAAEKFTAAPDHDAQLLCHFTMRDEDAAVISNVQVYTRKWLPVPNGVKSTQNTITPLGMFGRLPQNIRHMIYDLVCHPRFTNFDFTQQQVFWPQELPLVADFSVPALAHVCREMRRYAMCRYQLVWWSSKRVVSKINRSIEPSSMHQEETTRSGFGVFQPDEDVIEIHMETIDSDVELGEHATVEWNDLTQAPILTELSTRQVSYPLPELFFSPLSRTFELEDTFLTLIPKQSAMWEKTWKKDCRNKFQPTLRKI
ncbi:hypothetical protein F4781DRAFT_416046 [Annulohypoxylon bovei var. microspora]|nr:hypothetical protein F4781DRAFT_416046 [Annulohypoxylon bovei var. microspora]